MNAPVAPSLDTSATGPSSPRASPTRISWKRWFLPAAIITLVGDQISKWWVFSLPATTVFPDWIYRAENTGTAWSMFRDQPQLVTLLTLFLIPGLTWLWWARYRQAGAATNLSFGLILGGAVGNGIDRVAARLASTGPGASGASGAFGTHGVRDFIHVDLGFWPAHPWPDFNLADSGITIGFLVLVALSFTSPPPTSAARPVRP